MSHRTPFALSVAVVLLIGALASVGAQPTATQTLPQGLELLDQAGFSAWPFGAASPQRWQWIYDSTEFAVAGPIVIHEIWVRTAFPGQGVSAWSSPGVLVRLASSTEHYGQATTRPTFSGNTLFDRTDVRSGPWSGGAIPAAAGPVGVWIPLALTTPFVFDPSLENDLVVEISTSGGAGLPFLDLATGPVGQVGGNRYGSLATASTNIWTFTHVGSEFVPVLRIDYSLALGPPPLLIPQWQRNQTGASLSVDGASSTPTTPVAIQGPIRVARCQGSVSLAQLLGTAGSPFELGIALDAAIPGNEGGIGTATRQTVNVPVLAASMAWLNGLAFTTLLPATPLVVPFTLATPGLYVAQGLLAGPSLPEGFGLTALTSITVEPSGALVIPSADDAVTRLRFADPPLCASGTFTVYGVAYDEVFVSTNGRLLFGQGDASFSPSPAAALAGPPFLGAWTDLQPNLAGSIVATAGVGASLTVTYAGVPYFGQPSSASTFLVRLDLGTAACSIEGLDGLFPGGGPVFLGLSRGLGATDPGMTAFAAGAMGSVSVPTDMLYAQGVAGAVVPGVGQIHFTPGPGGGYGWLAVGGT